MHLDPLTKPRSTLMQIPEGDAGTLATLKIMRQLVRQFKKSDHVRQAALDTTAGLPHKDWRGEIMRVHAFCRDAIRYTGDVRGVETIQTPDRLLQTMQGDCDDKVTLCNAMLEALGHPTRQTALRFAGHTAYSHVIAETRIGTRWIPLELTEPWEPGVAPPGIAARMIVYN